MASCSFPFFVLFVSISANVAIANSLHAYCPGAASLWGITLPWMMGRTPARRKLILPRDVFRRMVRIPSPLALPARRSRRECTFKSGSNPAERPGTRNGQRFQYRCDGSPGNSGCQASSLRSSRVTGAFTRLLLLSSNNEIGHAAVRASYLPAN